MAFQVITPYNFNKLEIQNARIHFLTTGTAPSSPVEGQFYYASDTHLPYVWNGSAWTAMVSTGVTFATPAFTLTTAAAAGAATTSVRSDASIAIFDTTVPTTSAVGDSAAVGSIAFAARRDHTHGREAFGTVTAQTAFGSASGNGVASTEARSDHTHGTPTHIGSDHSAISISSLSAPTADVAWASHKITGLLDPTASQDAATKNYVDNVAQGLSPKPSVLLATTTALPGTYTYANGASGVGATLTAPANAVLTIDGVATALGNRILVKNEAAPANNGIYTVTTAGAAGAAAVLTRATDEDAASKIPGAFVFVEAGTSNGASGWVIANAGPFTVGTTAQTFTQFSGAGTYQGTAGQITLTGTVFSISTSYVGQTSITTLGTITTGTWTGTTIAVANGGTGQTSAANARGGSGLGAATAPTGAGTVGTVSVSNTGIPTKVIATIGDGSTTSIVVTHNLGTRDVSVTVYRATTPWDIVGIEVDITSINSITLSPAVAPTASQYNVVIIG